MSAQAQLDFTAPQLADAGIMTARRNADWASPGWNDVAYYYLKKFLLDHYEPFLGEDVRNFAEASGFEIPPSKRAWGGVIRAGQRNGLIRFVGYGVTQNPTAHCSRATRWVRSR